MAIFNDSPWQPFKTPSLEKLERVRKTCKSIKKLMEKHEEFFVTTFVINNVYAVHWNGGYFILLPGAQEDVQREFMIITPSPNSLIWRVSPAEKVNNRVVIPRPFLEPSSLSFRNALTDPYVKLFPKMSVAVPDVEKVKEITATPGYRNPQ